MVIVFGFRSKCELCIKAPLFAVSPLWRGDAVPADAGKALYGFASVGDSGRAAVTVTVVISPERMSTLVRGWSVQAIPFGLGVARISIVCISRWLPGGTWAKTKWPALSVFAW